MVGITYIPKGSTLATHGNPAPYRVAGSYRELLAMVIDIVNKQQLNTNENDMLLIRGSDRSEWARIPDEVTSVKSLLNVIRESRIHLDTLIKEFKSGANLLGIGDDVGVSEFYQDKLKFIEKLDQILSV